MISPLHAAVPRTTAAQPDDKLMQKAQELEAAYLTEMLGFSGMNTVSEDFGGGLGESQFASFLRHEQAKMMVARGGIGLAEMIFESLKGKGAP